MQPVDPLLAFDEAAFVKSATEFIRRKVESSGARGVVVGVSGGVDSSVTATLCVKAIGSNRVLLLFMPDEITTEEDRRCVSLLSQWLGVEVREVPITTTVYAFFDLLGRADRVTEGNLRARVRMVVLYWFANRERRLVVGTSNRSEWLTGYFTKYGDGASDLAPLLTLYKTQVWQLARWLGIPEFIVNRTPSARLWSGQEDERELGIRYTILDSVLVRWERGYDPKAIASEIEAPLHVVDRIVKLVQSSSHKRQLPQHL